MDNIVFSRRDHSLQILPARVNAVTTLQITDHWRQTLWRTASRRIDSGTVFAGNVSHVPARSSADGTLLELVADVNLTVLENNPNCTKKW